MLINVLDSGQEHVVTRSLGTRILRFNCEKAYINSAKIIHKDHGQKKGGGAVAPSPPPPPPNYANVQCDK